MMKFHEIIYLKATGKCSIGGDTFRKFCRVDASFFGIHKTIFYSNWRNEPIPDLKLPVSTLKI